MKATILFTGGHHNSSLIIAKALKRQGYKIAWIGHKYATRGDKSISAEYQEVVKNSIPFYELKTGKFYKTKNPLEFLKIAFGFIQAFFYLVSIKPALIVSFGGYLAVPSVIAGHFLGIPAITHEQTAISGWANKAIAPFVGKILLTHRSSSKNFAKFKDKTIHVGLPIEADFAKHKQKKKKFDPPLLFVTAGKQGSHTFNSAIFPLVSQLAKRFTLVHQTGANTAYKDLDKARRIQAGLGPLKSRYVVAPYFFRPQQISYLSSAQLIISRAGAHTCYEISLLRQRAVVIPIPWVSHNEQLKNAQLAAKFAPITILKQKDLNPQSLLEAIDKTLTKKAKPSKIPPLPLDADQKILKLIHKYV